ncbi:hypothetical protein SKAU_G00368470 [Synaphobranchus kaupii]|uniref:Uncharacterized protein n=1 Tax=Synaphobranchus kaupii TaxID=118154 RepID=A0A9Q1EFK6_SYNKA|nr:hypothetical protein SKAU_G00368470 [Synaphobranchus kaupii]
MPAEHANIAAGEGGGGTYTRCQRVYELEASRMRNKAEATANTCTKKPRYTTGQRRDVVPTSCPCESCPTAATKGTLQAKLVKYCVTIEQEGVLATAQIRPRAGPRAEEERDYRISPAHARSRLEPPAAAYGGSACAPGGGRETEVTARGSGLRPAPSRLMPLCLSGTQ